LLSACLFCCRLVAVADAKPGASPALAIVDLFHDASVAPPDDKSQRTLLHLARNVLRALLKSLCKAILFYSAKMSFYCRVLVSATRTGL
jgi:hypothetical protein